jgi:anti-sigma B factor antagonist
MSEGFDDLELLVTRTRSGAHVSISGDVDLASVARLRTALDSELHGATGDVTVDLSKTSFCDSAGLGALIAARVDLQVAGRTMRLVNPSPCVMRLLQLTATAELFEITTAPTFSGDLNADPPDDGVLP